MSYTLPHCTDDAESLWEHESPPIRLATSWDERNLPDPDFEWHLIRPNHNFLEGIGSRQANSLGGSWKVWYKVNFGGTIKTYVFYNKVSSQNHTEIIEVVGFPYESLGGKSLPPSSTIRAVLMGLFTSFLEQNSIIRWIIVAWSIAEVFLGLRGRAWNAPDRWRPTILRGVLPAIVAIIGSNYAYAMTLFIVSCLPFYRGKIQTIWIMETEQFMTDLSIQILFSMFALWCITKTCYKLRYDSDSRLFDNPLSLFVTQSVGDNLDFWLRNGKGWGAILGSWLIMLMCMTMMKLFGGPLRMWYGEFTHEHSRFFFSWRVRMQLDLARRFIEPCLGAFQYALDILVALVVFVVFFSFRSMSPSSS